MNKCDLTLTICVFFQHDYQHKGPVYRFLRKVMALPFLPWEQIETAFEALNDQVTTPKIARFMKYVKKTWSVYKMSVRTNNGKLYD